MQLVLNGGGTPVGVVSSPDKADLLHDIGVEHVIDRKAEGYRFWSDEHTQDEREWRRFGKDIRGLIGDDPDIVFEHPGRSTMGASVFVAKRGGTVVTCAATSGYMIEYDNRHLWMKLKRIVSSHFANYQEAWEMNRLIDRGAIQPILSAVFELDQIGEAALQVHRNLHEGKLGILCLAPSEGSGHHRSREARAHRRGQDHGVPAPRRRLDLTADQTLVRAGHGLACGARERYLRAPWSMFSKPFWRGPHRRRSVLSRCLRSYRGAHIRADDVGMFEGLESDDKDPRQVHPRQ